MGIFNALGAISRANDILKRLEEVFDLLEHNLNIGNYSSARTYCNEAASNVRKFIEVIEQSSAAEIAVYKFKGQKFRVVQLSMLFTQVLGDINTFLKNEGF